MARPNRSHSEDRPFILRGSRIGFKALHREDLPLYARWFQNLEFVTYISAHGIPQSLENETEWFDKASKNTEKSVCLGIHELKTGRLLGNGGLFEIQPKNCAKLGIGIGDPTMWGKGYGTEATRLLAEYGLFFLNLHNIRLHVYGYNERAHRAYLKAGFKEVGRVRGTIMLGGERYDEIIMDITRDDVDLSRMRKLVRQVDQPRT